MQNLHWNNILLFSLTQNVLTDLSIYIYIYIYNFLFLDRLSMTVMKLMKSDLYLLYLTIILSVISLYFNDNMDY